MILFPILGSNLSVDGFFTAVTFCSKPGYGKEVITQPA